MKRLTLVLGIIAAAVTAASVVPLWQSRSVGPVETLAEPDARRFDPEQSAALFIGVRRFDRDEMVEVPYAADDAVDLAYMFAINVPSRLVPPERVVIALSGRPQKKESLDRLRKLKAAGARVESADAVNIRELLQQQAALAGTDGLLIVSLATHGFLSQGVPFILGADSTFLQPATAISAASLFDTARQSKARRSLIFVDACRDRIAQGTRGSGNVNTAAPLIRRMENVEGQVILYAAAAGEVAWDDSLSRNGVFTKAVIEGLSCKATAIRGIVTAQSLHAFVESQVAGWLKRERSRPVRYATQFSSDGRSHNMPLSCCWTPCPFPSGPESAEGEGSHVVVFGPDRVRLWWQELGSRVVQAEIADLDADRRRAVVAASEGGLRVFDRKGNSLWSASESLALRGFAIPDRFRSHARPVVALFSSANASRLKVFESDGGLRSTFEFPGELQHLVVGRATSRHAPKIIVSSESHIFMLHPKHAITGKSVWSGEVSPPEKIAELKIADRGEDTPNQISITTVSGKTFMLDFSGNVVSGNAALFRRLTPRRRHAQ